MPLLVEVTLTHGHRTYGERLNDYKPPHALTGHVGHIGDGPGNISDAYYHQNHARDGVFKKLRRGSSAMIAAHMRANYAGKLSANFLRRYSVSQ